MAIKNKNKNNFVFEKNIFILFTIGCLIAIEE